MSTSLSPAIDLVLEQASREFPPNRLALDRATTRIRFGETVAIVGPSGSGKSTLLAILGLLDRPSSGRYLVGGVDTAELGPKKRAQVRAQQFGFVFQAFHLVPYLTALENVEIGLMISGVARASRYSIAAASLNSVGMEKHASTRAMDLSGGEQQRVAIARALAREPSILFCDEPTGNLDSANAELVLHSIFSDDPSSAPRSTIVVTHDPELALQCDRILQIVDGALTEPSRTQKSDC